MNNYTPPIVKLIFNVENIASALWIENEDAQKEFTDGRVISRFAEYWAGKLYNFKKCENTNEEGYDGFIDSPLFGRYKVAVRSLTKTGIRFQQSKFIGSGRKCTQKNLIDSLEQLDFEIVVDIIDFPCVIFLPISKNNLTDFITTGKLTPNGWKRDVLYNILYGKSHDEILINETKII